MYRCDTYKDCTSTGCRHYLPHTVEGCDNRIPCQHADSIVMCNPVGSEPVTSLESTIDAIIVEELERSAHPFPDVATRIRNKILELIST